MRVYTDDHVRPETWTQEAACATTNVDMWFAEHGDKATSVEAKRICRETCDVREQCLEYAMRTKPRDGIWAGYTVKSLQRLRRNRP